MTFSAGGMSMWRRSSTTPCGAAATSCTNTVAPQAVVALGANLTRGTARLRCSQDPPCPGPADRANQRVWLLAAGRDPGRVCAEVATALGQVCGALQPTELVVVEADGEGPEVLVHALGATGAGDRHDRHTEALALGEQPRQRDLGRGGSHLGGNGRDDPDDALVGL